MHSQWCKERFPQGGLEILCKYVFKTIKHIESEKARAVIEDGLAIRYQQSCKKIQPKT